jgi:hypothetical protein
LSPRFHTREMMEVGHAFRRNALRIASLASVPTFLVGAAGRYQCVYHEATYEVLKKPLIETDEDHEREPEIIAAFNRKLPDVVGSWDYESSRPVFDENLEIFAQWDGTPVMEGLRAMLAAQVISALTMFETLAKDAWIAAVNSRPRILGSQKELLEGKIPGSMLQKYDFDLRQHMGDLLSDRFHFDSPSGAREAYSCAFGKDSELLAHMGIEALSKARLIRNVLVHSAGVADHAFVRGMRKSARWSNVEIGDQVNLQGSTVAAITRITISCSMRLLLGIDGWLHRHPE